MPFLKKKQNPAPVTSVRPLQHLPSPTAASERRQVISVRRDGTMPSFSQLDGNVNHCPTSPPPGLTSTASTNTTALIPVVAAATVIAALWRKSSQLDVGLDAKPGALGRQANFINEARDHLSSLCLAQLCGDAACMCSRQAVISTEVETAG